MNSPDIIFQEVKEKLNEQLSSIDQISNKFNFTIAFDGLVIAGIIQGFAGKSGVSWLIKVSVMAFLVSALFSGLGLLLRKYRRDPDPSKLAAKYLDKDAEKTKKALIGNYIESYSKNTTNIKRLGFFYILSVIALFAGIIFMASYFL
jgi:hypothetical protein